MIDWQAVQIKWQKAWADLGKASVSDKPKFYMIFAYPGVSGYLHVGHMRGFSYTDAICRYERMQGKEVLFTVGTHASGNQAIAFANKVKNKDEAWITYLKKNGCDDRTIAKLEDPKQVIAYFNEVYVEEYWKKFGFICDWDRFTCTTDPDYEKFIQWQFKKLKERGLLIQKPYFAPFSEKSGPVAIDPSETDLSKGGNAEKQEYTLLKFQFNNMFLVAATLRPETIYGQTNLWINPEARYVAVKIGGETWVLSEQAAQKLQWQKDDVLLQGPITVTQMLGKTAVAPGINRAIPILPASFVHADVGTGIVTSVPSDAPFDYVALQALKQDPVAQAIELIPIIQSKGYGKFPAQEIVQKLGITSLKDPKLDEATKEIYKAGHHTGVMRENCGPYAGKTVEQAKERIKADLLEQSLADIFYDLSEEVICRNGGKVFIKRIDDQWFIRYSDADVTAKSKMHVSNMAVFPPEYGQHLPAILDWFHDRACVRLGNWLGSAFPYDPKWTIEPISDSTLYPVYYIVSGYVQRGQLTVEDLTEEFFDYVFLGKGKAASSIWKDVKKEFDYFYPLDMNLGGKEHKTVHFPVFVMNHVAILPPEKWPKGIFANWWVTGKGSKISKSKGGAQPIPQAIEKYGVDAMRLYYAHIGSPHADVVWDETVVGNYKQTLERIYGFLESLELNENRTPNLDSWILARLHSVLAAVDTSMKSYQLRDLASLTYYNLYDDLKWYSRRGGSNQSCVNEFCQAWIKLMNPLTPHFAEELGQRYSDVLLASTQWPKWAPGKMSEQAIYGEDLVKQTLLDFRQVEKLSKLPRITQGTVFIAQEWLYDVCKVIKRELAITRNMGEIIRVVLTECSGEGKAISKVVAMAIRDPAKLPTLVLDAHQEFEILNQAKTFLEKELGYPITIIDQSDDPKAMAALPGKVGMLLA